MHRLTVARLAVVGVAFSPDGQWLATASNDHTVKVWNLKELNLKEADAASILLPHNAGVMGIAFTRDSTRLAHSGHAGKVRFWDLTTIKELKGRAPTLTLDGPKTPKRSFFLGPFSLRKAAPKWPVTSLAFNPDNNLAVANEDGNVEIWDAGSQP